MSENSELYDPLSPSILSALQDENDIEIQRHGIELVDSCIEISPVITRRRISSIAEEVLTPKKLNDGLLQTKPTEIEEVFIIERTTPENQFGEVKKILPRCPMKIFHNKRVKSEKMWKKLPMVADSNAALFEGSSRRDGHMFMIENAAQDKKEIGYSSLYICDIAGVVDGPKTSPIQFATERDRGKEFEEEQGQVSSPSFSQISNKEDPLALKDASGTLNVSHQNDVHAVIANVILHTPKSGMLMSNSFHQKSIVLKSSDKKGESFPLSDASPLLWGSCISGISPLSQSSTTTSIPNQDYKGSPLQVISLGEEYKNKTINILTSTPLSSKMNLDWEDISTVTDGQSDNSSSMLPLHKISKLVNSSELHFSEEAFSQESTGSEYDNCDINYKTRFHPSSQELSGSDKENIEPNSKENYLRVKRIRVETGLDCDGVGNYSNSRESNGSEYGGCITDYKTRCNRNFSQELSGSDKENIEPNSKENFRRVQAQTRCTDSSIQILNIND